HTRSKRDWSSDVCSSDLGKLGKVSSPQVLGRVSGAFGRIKGSSQVYLAFRAARVKRGCNEIQHKAAVAAFTPLGQVVVDFGDLPRQERGHTGLIVKYATELVTTDVIVELVRMGPDEIGLQRIDLLDLVHVNSVAVVQLVGGQVGVEVLRRFRFGAEIRNFALKIRVFFIIGLDHIKVGGVAPDTDNGAPQHLRNTFKNALDAVTIHQGATQRNKSRRVDSLNRGILPGELFGELIDKGVAVLRGKSYICHGVLSPHCFGAFGAVTPRKPVTISSRPRS